MANIASAKKRARQSEVRRLHNQSTRSTTRTAVRKVLAAVEAGDKDAATAHYKTAVSLLDKTANKGMIHRNKASRHKSRLNRAIVAMG